MWYLSTVFLAVGFAYVFFESGSARAALAVTLWLSPVVLFASYFMSRRTGAASTSEARIARGWILFRWTVCYTAAIVLGLISVGMVYMGVKSANTGLAASGAFFGALAFVSARIGAYGSETKYALTGDKEAHRQRKNRYGWK